MKKIFTLLVFVFMMVLSTESVIAQNKIEINTSAAKKTEMLRKIIKFNEEQREQVYQAYKGYGNAIANLKQQQHIEDYAIKKLGNELESIMKSILTEKQYEYYKRFSDNEN